MKFITVNNFTLCVLLSIVCNGSSIQAFGFEEHAMQHNVTLAEVVDSYPKFEVIRDYLLTQLSARAEILGKQPSGKDFITIYDAMPKDLQKDLNSMYLTMPISAQNEAIEQFGYDPNKLHAVIANEIAQRAVKKVNKEFNKATKSLNKWWNSK